MTDELVADLTERARSAERANAELRVEVARLKAADLEWLRLARAVYHAATEEAERSALHDLREHSKGCGWADISPPLAQLLSERAEKAEVRVGELESAIRAHRDQRGDDRCWMDDETLYRVLPEGYTPPARDSRVELELCRRYIACRHNPAMEYVSPQRRIEDLEVLTAWADGSLSEGQACHLLGLTTDPVRAREMLQEALAAARSRWGRWRDCNPPSPG